MIKSRAASQGNPPTPAPQSIDAVRRRARHRLIGASILVLVGVVGFSLLFDTQPRPIAVDIPIEIPSKTTPVASEQGSRSVAAAPTSQSTAMGNEETGRVPDKSVDAAPAAPVQAAPAVPPTPAPAPAPADPPRVLAPPPEPTPPSGAASSAKTAPSASSAPAASAGSDDSATLRLVVQVGAFAEPARAREVRLKIEAAGLKTYTHVAETSEGRRTRVRVGPFSSRAEADKAAARVKALGYPARILTL